MATPTRDEMVAYITMASKAAGVDPATMLAMAQIESGFRPGIRNIQAAGSEVKLSSAVGLYQFIEKTGAQYGLVGKGFDNRGDYKASTDAAIRLYKDNLRQYAGAAKKAGYDPNDPALAYLAHQWGVGGLQNMLGAVGSGKTVNDVLKDSAAKGNGMDGMTVEQGFNKWGGKMAKQYAKFQGVGPSKFSEAVQMAQAPMPMPMTPQMPQTPQAPAASQAMDLLNASNPLAQFMGSSPEAAPDAFGSAPQAPQGPQGPQAPQGLQATLGMQQGQPPVTYAMQDLLRSMVDDKGVEALSSLSKPTDPRVNDIMALI